MSHKLHYDTVSNAIARLREQGFTVDFNLKENVLVHGENSLAPDDFSVVDIYRYEGESDPSDEAAVYAIEATDGAKGILVMGYGISADSVSEPLLKKLQLA